MSQNGVPSLEVFPPELLLHFMSHITNKQRKAVGRVSSFWRYLSQVPLSPKEKIKEVFSFLMTPQEVDNLTDEESLAIVKKQYAIYDELGKPYGLPKGFFSEKWPEAFLDPDLKKQLNLETSQVNFLNALAVASNVDDFKLMDTGQKIACCLMAGIGNIEKLQSWGEIYRKFDCFWKQNAQKTAARFGQLESLQYLIERDNRIGIKGLLLETNKYNQLNCAQYLSQKYESSKWDAEVLTDILEHAAHADSLQCFTYLFVEWEEKLSDENKEQINRAAHEYGPQCAVYLSERSKKENDSEQERKRITLR